MGGIACGNVSSDDGWAAIHHAIGQCVSGEYSCGHCAVYLLGCVQAEAESELLSGGGMTLFGVCCLSLTADFRLDFGAGLSLLAAVAFSLQMAFLGNLTKDCDSVHIAIVENLSTLAVMTVILMFTGWDMPPLTLPAFGNFFLRRGHFAPHFILCCKASDSKSTAPNKAAIIITTESIFCGGIFCDFIRRTDALQGDIWGVR